MTVPTRRINNWERWGKEDERGALNFVGPADVLSSLRMVRRGEVFSLSLPLSTRGTPVGPGRTPPVHLMSVDGGDYANGARSGPGNYRAADDYLITPCHSGTHIDALAHVWTGDQMYNGFPQTEVRSTSGARRLGIDKFQGLVTRGVLLDIAGQRGEPRLEPGYAITPEDLAGCATRAGVEVRRGDAVLIRTGWLQTLKEIGEEAYRREAGINLAAAHWLLDREIVLVGADNYGLEVMPAEPDRPGLPAHVALLRDNGTYIIELLALDELASKGVSEFLFVAAPLPIVGGVGSPLNPLAIV